jgi:hypothetical protein
MYKIVKIKCITLLSVIVNIKNQLHYRVELHQRYCRTPNYSLDTELEKTHIIIIWLCVCIS